MGLEDYVFLGYLSDEEEAEETQEEVNERSLHLYDQSQLIDGIGKRMSRSELRLLMERLKNSNDEFWTLLLKIIIKEYSLNPLKLYIAEGFSGMNRIREIKRLVIFIKIILIERVIDKGVDININRGEFEDFISDLKPPELMRLSIKLIDRESFGLFIKKIFSESKEDYTDE